MANGELHHAEANWSNSAVHAQATAALHHDTFSNPTAFLKTLQQNFNDIAGGDDQITRSDLLDYSKHGLDPNARLAAGIAVDHFSELKQMSQRLGPGYDSADKIDYGELDFAENVAAGNYDQLTGGKSDGEKVVAVGFAALGTGCGALALASLPFPPAAIAFGAMTGISYAGAAFFAFTPPPGEAEMRTDNIIVNKTVAPWLHGH